MLYGPRQVGKTTLVQDLLATTCLPQRYISADELVYREALASQDRRTLGDLLGDSELLVIDEAQRVPDIGLNLKILVDNYPHAAILATGSASFDLANKVSEPLTGRKLTLNLYPGELHEMRETVGAFEARAQLERWLIWGGYPAMVTAERRLRERCWASWSALTCTATSWRWTGCGAPRGSWICCACWLSRSARRCR